MVSITQLLDKKIEREYEKAAEKPILFTSKETDENNVIENVLYIRLNKGTISPESNFIIDIK